MENGISTSAISLKIIYPVFRGICMSPVTSTSFTKITKKKTQEKFIHGAYKREQSRGSLMTMILGVSH